MAVPNVLKRLKYTKPCFMRSIYRYRRILPQVPKIDAEMEALEKEIAELLEKL
ncbi:MAG: hypothetical protein PHC50_05450 [Candidatus Cloacimonetes bacterium]|nr:hypothetical protein [Candidatus Cloacimonadota bacterium]